jgi:hypothetical protein
MLFRFVGVVCDLGLREEGAWTVVFTMGQPAVRVELRGDRGQAVPAGPTGTMIIGNRVEIHCEATMEDEPEPTVRAAFESLAAGRLPKNSLSPEKWPKPLTQMIASGEIRGPLRGVPMDSMPHEFPGFREAHPTTPTGCCDESGWLAAMESRRAGPVTALGALLLGPREDSRWWTVLDQLAIEQPLVAEDAGDSLADAAQSKVIRPRASNSTPITAALITAAVRPLRPIQALNRSARELLHRRRQCGPAWRYARIGQATTQSSRAHARCLPRPRRARQQVAR